MRQETFNELKSQLNEQDIDELTDILCKGCQEKTRRKIRINLECSTSFIPNHGILDRLIKKAHDWQYLAGQSYPDEIKVIRDIVKDLK